jgi:hypothetical protein
MSIKHNDLIMKKGQLTRVAKQLAKAEQKGMSDYYIAQLKSRLKRIQKEVADAKELLELES